MTFSKDIFLDDKQETTATSKLESQTQKNINARIDGMSVRQMAGTEYDNSTHYSNFLYLVTRDGVVEMYKGDTRIYFGRAIEVSHCVLQKSLT